MVLVASLFIFESMLFLIQIYFFYIFDFLVENISEEKYFSEHTYVCIIAVTDLTDRVYI